MSLRFASVTLTLLVCISCGGLNYPIPEPVPDPALGAANGAGGPISESALSWNELTFLARRHVQRGELEEARERLAQAATQVADLAATNVQRQTVFGLRARLSTSFAAAGEFEDADEMADQLLAAARAEPELGGLALVSLAISVADRRRAAFDEEDEPESVLPLFRTAFIAAQTAPVSRDRMALAFRVAGEAYREDDFELARLAIDQALLDARRLDPDNKSRQAALQILKARIALAQGDLETARGVATSANLIVDEISTSFALRGLAEMILAETLAKQGDLAEALIIARGAHAQLDAGEPIQEHARRQILSGLARVERSGGDLASARLHFRQALEVASDTLPPDVHLVKQITRELQELDSSVSPSKSDSE